MAKCCHGSPPGNASRRYLAKTGSPGTHRGDILPLSDAGGGRISRTFRHRRAPGNASWRYFGIATMFGNTQRRYVATARRRRRRPKRRAALSTGVGPNRWKSTRLKSVALSTRGSGLESLACVWASARSTFYASMRPFACAPVQGGGSPSRNLIAGNGFESALFRWATMSPLRVPRSCAVSCAEAKCALTFMSGAANVVEGMSWAFARQWEIWQAL